jgi:hypothetical protein
LWCRIFRYGCERLTTAQPVGDAAPRACASPAASLNAKRRNLSPAQRAMATAEAWDMLETKPGPKARNEPKNGLNGKRSDHLGKMFGVGGTYVEQARFVIENDPPALA